MGGGAGFIRERLCPCCKIQRNGGVGDYVYGVKFIGGIMSMQIYVRLYKNDQGGGGGGGGGSISLAILKLIFFTIVHICKGNI